VHRDLMSSQVPHFKMGVVAGQEPREFNQAGYVSRNHLLAHCIGQGGAQYLARLVDRGDRLSVGEEIIEKVLYDPYGQAVKSVVSKARLDVETYYCLISFSGKWYEADLALVRSGHRRRSGRSSSTCLRTVEPRRRQCGGSPSGTDRRGHLGDSRCGGGPQRR
jgi:hypothetical protein